MAEVLDGLHPDTPVKLVAGQDCICKNCPNQGTKCPNAAVYDQRVLSLCGLQTGQILSWKQLQEAVACHVVQKGRLAAVCGGCEWAALCRTKAYRITGGPFDERTSNRSDRSAHLLRKPV